MTPLVDVIIPIHDASRPLPRTLRSLTRSGLRLGEELRVNVVCHNIDVGEVRRLVGDDLANRVRFLECMDGLPSPAGPRSLALRNTDARYVSFVDSDDFLEDDALRSWVELADLHHLDAVIPAERHDNGRKIRTPVVRPRHSGNLDPIADRLSYRTAPLGLLRRSTIERVGAEFATGVRNGSDQIFALKIWFGDTRIRFGRGLPNYVVVSDATTRVSTQVQPLEDAFKATLLLFADPWFSGLELRERRAIVVKFMRVQFMAGVARRLDEGIWGDATAQSAVDFLRTAREVAPGFENSLSIADVRLCRAIIHNRQSDVLQSLMRRRRAFGWPTTVLTTNLRNFLLPDAPFRFMLAALLH